MYGLPISTERKKQLPKKAIFAKFDLKASQRESFDTDIARIDIVAVVSAATVPALSEGSEVKEFYVLAVQMKRKEYDSKNIALLTKLIPQKMVFALQFEEQTQFAIYHTKLISSTWQSSEDATLPLSGLNLDAVWESLITQVGGITIQQGNTLDEQIAADEEQAKLEKEIARLEKLAWAEKQPKKKFEYKQRIDQLLKKVGDK